MSCEDQPPYAKQLALKIFAVTPHSASCERMFSVLGWLYGKRRTFLDTSTIESIAKIWHFYQNTMHSGFSVNSSKGAQEFDDFQKLVNESEFFEEDNDDDENNGEGYEEYFEEIPNHDVYVLIEDYIDVALLPEEDD